MVIDMAEEEFEAFRQTSVSSTGNRGSNANADHRKYSSESLDSNYRGRGSMDLTSNSDQCFSQRKTFIEKVWDIVNSPDSRQYVQWVDEDVFSISSPARFSSEILPRFFRHNNWQSFVRQLNMYDFHKVNDVSSRAGQKSASTIESPRWDFRHPLFRRHNPELHRIRRKRSGLSTAERSVSPSSKSASYSYMSASLPYLESGVPARVKSPHGPSGSRNFDELSRRNARALPRSSFGVPTPQAEHQLRSDLENLSESLRGLSLFLGSLGERLGLHLQRAAAVQQSLQQGNVAQSLAILGTLYQDLYASRNAVINQSYNEASQSDRSGSQGAYLLADQSQPVLQAGTGPYRLEQPLYHPGSSQGRGRPSISNEWSSMHDQTAATARDLAPLQSLMTFSSSRQMPHRSEAQYRGLDSM